ncbi:MULTISPECIES: hypothetical protein [Pseudoalteromonas]|uniref:hypothetical protein n=1 Tax=Pseudoalteromonas TaxID=53246 RepID=UPI000348897E|nr:MULTISPECIES: hypothetical protein [Pseudoalteromonas]MCG7545697.1 hypothetical protein [Pseudoalteromonas sp. MM17-2]GAP73931.1 hypothetical protein W04_0442 [Pseudoalteromonas sp. SW0106-04]|tara:strand:+ start:7390 stop:7998 length:609 start_codon:yes stop_codon:yes gene_type:complete
MATSPPQDKKIPKVLQQVDNKELRSTGFWLNQVFLVLSTIFGVYLAAQSGLEQAIKFDTYSKMEDNYYLRTSLYDELLDNQRKIQAYAELLAKSPPTSELEFNKPTLDKYVWHTMQYSPTTLETPSAILSAARRFYSQSEFYIERALKRKVSARHASEKLGKLATDLEQNTLPYLKRSAQALKQELADNDVQIGSLKELEHE